MNDRAELLQRKASGSLRWAAVVGMAFVPALFLLISQGLVSAGYRLAGAAHPFQAAAKWWTVWSSLADLACLGLLAGLTRREGIRLIDLMGLERRRLVRDVFLGICLFLPMLLIDIGGLILGDYLVYGNWLPLGIPAGFAGRVLPAWAALYSRILWWPLWSWIEEMTFNGYALPRLQALSGHTGFAVALVGFAWSFQHLFLPAILDGRYLLWKFLVFIPFNVLMPLLYLRMRRLTPIVVAHWGLDLLTTLFTIV